MGCPGKVHHALSIMNDKGSKALKKAQGDFTFVVDEVDSMLEFNFLNDLKRISKYLPTVAERNNYFFSATMD